jgi:polysaccharide deacetylase family protein (PEP-CTERM system associated)
MPSPADITHAMSFDIEDWFHIVGVRGLEAKHWDALTTRHTLVERYTDDILQACADAGTRATFFVLGWIAERYPALVRRVADAGHEIASHGHMHDPVGQLGPERFAEDLNRSIEAIGSACGVRVRGYRAPSFSIVPGCEWAFDALADAGIEWDSSLFPAPRGHGGYPCARAPHIVVAPGGARIAELPMSVWSPAGGTPIRLGFSGGGYLRLLPYATLQRAMASEARAGRPTVVYLHPRDLAADCPRWPMPPHRRFKSYVGLATARRKLDRLLADMAWEPCGNVISRYVGEVATPSEAGTPT